MITTVFILLLVYQLKHWVCDFPLQNEYMLGKFKEKGWILPLAAHAWIHFLGTYLIASFYSGNTTLAGRLALFDFVVHFTMDRIKASPKLMGRWKPLTKEEYIEAKGWATVACAHGEHDMVPGCAERKAAPKKLLGNTLFWWALGFDQMVHHLTHYAIIYVLLS